MKTNQIKKPGFTLIELILYLSIVTIVMSALIPFAWSVITSGTKNSTQQHLFSQARFVSEKIKREIRNASDINSVAATSISLATSTPSTNPTIIDLSGGQIRITQGAGSAVNLLANNTTASDLTFTDFSSGDDLTKHIQFTLSLETNFSSAGHEYQESTTIRSSAEIRSN